MQSVPGGSHWGGGVSIGSRDQARIGMLLLDKGRAGLALVVSPGWVKAMLAPCPIAPFYGYLTWRNHERRVFPSAPDASCFAIGAGGSFTWIEPERRMVLVVRWIHSDHADEFFGRVLRALDGA